jgi:DNA invertase Pin-like site-specific DNA recombinase
MQQADLRNYCAQRGFTIYQEYSDQGISGTKEERTGSNRVMSDARKKKFDCLLVWRFDRWARSSKHLVMTLDELRSLAIEFVSYQENIDTSSPLGKAMFTIVAAIAELERNIIVERIKGGLRRAKALGKHIGRPMLRNSQQVEAVRRMRTQGQSYQVIARTLGISKSAAHKWSREDRLNTTGDSDAIVQKAI